MNLADKPLNDISFVSQTSDSFAQLISEFVQAVTAHILQLDVLQIVPSPFIRVKLRRIARQLRQIDTCCTSFTQKGLDLPTAMSRQSIPDDQQLPGEVSQQVLQKADDGFAVERFVLRHRVQLAFRRDRADHRQMLPVPIAQHWCLTTRSPSTHRAWQKGKPGFVYEDEGSVFSVCFFFNSGQVSSCQRSTASSSRWSARSTGFCRLQPIRRRSRPTWTSLYETPYSCLMTAPTRPRVHTSPRKPYASGPALSNSGNRSSCAAVSFGLAPLPERVRRVVIPPSRARFSHWLTAAGVTPRASAMSACFQPFRFSCHARNRRASRQSRNVFGICSDILPVYTKLADSLNSSCSDQ